MVVLDNASDADYTPTLKLFPELPLSYERRDQNIGGMRNIARALARSVSSEFLMVFHDDDLMHPELLESEIAVLEAHPELRFTACELAVFDEQHPPVPESRPPVSPVILRDEADLALAIIRGANIPFDSVIYRASALQGVTFDLERYGTLADRPLLLSIAAQGGCALIPRPLVHHRHHGGQISKSLEITDENLLALFRFYRTALAKQWNWRTALALYSMVGRGLMTFRQIPPEKRTEGFLRFIRRLRRADVVRYPFLLLSIGTSVGPTIRYRARRLRGAWRGRT